MDKKNNYRRAVGLRYEGGLDETPRLSLKEEGVNAQYIIKLARRFGVPIISRPELASALQVLEIDSSIPEELYEAVAIVINQIETQSYKVTR